MIFLEFIRELSDHIGEDWKALARSLGLKKTDIDAISHDNQGSLKEQIYQFFEKWKQRNGRNATVQQLVDGLRKAKLFDQLENLQEAGFISKGLWLPHSSCKFKVIFCLLSPLPLSQPHPLAPLLVPSPASVPAYSVRLQGAPDLGPAYMQCKTPGCTRPRRMMDDGSGYYDYCGRMCRDPQVQPSGRTIQAIFGLVEKCRQAPKHNTEGRLAD